MIAALGERQAGEGDAVGGRPGRTDGGEHGISMRLRAQRVHGLGKDLGCEKRVVRRVLVGELEDERSVRGLACRERQRERRQRDASVAERDRISPRQKTARVDEHGVAHVDPLGGALDVCLWVWARADDHDVKPEARQSAAQPGERFATKGQVAGARVRRSDDERQPHFKPRGMYDRPPPGDEAPRTSPVVFRASFKKLQPAPERNSQEDRFLCSHEACMPAMS